MSPLFGIALFGIVFLIIVVAIIIFILIILVVLYLLDYKKFVRYSLISLGSIFLIGSLFFIFSIFKNFYSKDEKLKEVLNRKHSIILKNDFEVISEREIMDFDLYKREFKIKLSNDDANSIKRKFKLQSSNSQIKDSTKKTIDSINHYTIYDTLRIKLNGKIIDYYHSNETRETPFISN